MFTNESSEFSIDLAQDLLNSDEEFPVDLDSAWQWIGYSSKQGALRKLESRFTLDVDYTFSRLAKSEFGAGSSLNKYMLTVDCFKSLGMMAETSKGDQIRLYFLQCEKQMKVLIAEKISQLEHNNRAKKHLKKAAESLELAHKEDKNYVLLWFREMGQKFGFSLDSSDRVQDLELKSKQLDNMSKAANRVGLAMNKNIKVMDRVGKMTDPTAFLEMRNGFLEVFQRQQSELTLMESEIRSLQSQIENLEHQEFKLKLAKSQIESLTSLISMLMDSLKSLSILAGVKVNQSIIDGLNFGYEQSIQTLIDAVITMRKDHDQMIQDLSRAINQNI